MNKILLVCLLLGLLLLPWGGLHKEESEKSEDLKVYLKSGETERFNGDLVWCFYLENQKVWRIHSLNFDLLRNYPDTLVDSIIFSRIKLVN